MVTIGGVEYQVKALTVRQVREAQSSPDQSDADIVALALSTGCDRAVVAEWYDSHPAGVVFAAVKAMWEATNSTEDARFPDGAANDAGDERAGV